MFQIPDWGDDIPKSNISFGKRSKKKQNPTERVDKSTTPNKKKVNIDTKITINKDTTGLTKTKKIPVKNIQNRPNVTSISVKQNGTAQTNGINKKGKLKSEKFKEKVNFNRNNTNQSFSKTQKSKKFKANPHINNKSTALNNNSVASPVNCNENIKKSNGSFITSNNKSPSDKKINFKNTKPPKNSNKPKNKKVVITNGDAATNDDLTEEDKGLDTSVDDIQNIDGDKADEVLLKSNKRKFNEAFQKDDQEKVLFSESDRDKNIRKEKIKKMMFKSKNLINEDRNSIKANGNNLRHRMMERLKAAQFRYLNEKLYTSSGTAAKELFQSDPAAFHTYHEGYQLQVKKWPVNPLDVIVKRIQKLPKTSVIADMGCGEAALAKRVKHTIRSFDLVATAPGVEVCDMAHTPLQAASVDAAVYCLALMGTDLTQYLVEANRVLKMSGHLLIAEVESRFDNVEEFTKEVQRLGFKLVNLDKSNHVFFFLEFVKIRDPPVKKSKLPQLTLKPCLYKRR